MVDRSVDVQSFVRLLLVIVLCTSCVPNEHGRISAIGTGQLIDPPAPRERALDALEVQCGVPIDNRASSQLVRSPYLQSVTDASAVLVWASRSSEPEHVVVTRAGGVEMTIRAAGEPEATRFLESGSRQYFVRLEGLAPRTTYCYSIVGANGVVLGPLGFRTAPLRDSPETVNILAFGDSGTGSSDQWALRRQMDTVPIDLIVHVGDIAYPSGTLTEYETTFFGVYDPLLSSIPFFPTIGNHDDGTASGGPYREIFVLPDNGTGEGVERWYSFDWGSIHFVSLDTETNGAAQAAWLESDLERNELPWVIVFAHRPAYSSGFYGTGLHSITNTWLSLYLPILRRHRVPLVVTGHDHHYERTQPIDGVTFVVTGAGGASTRVPSPQSWTAFAEDAVHFVLMRIAGDELRLHALDATGREFDAHVIRRQ